MTLKSRVGVALVTLAKDAKHSLPHLSHSVPCSDYFCLNLILLIRSNSVLAAVWTSALFEHSIVSRVLSEYKS